MSASIGGFAPGSITALPTPTNPNAGHRPRRPASRTAVSTSGGQSGNLVNEPAPFFFGKVASMHRDLNHGAAPSERTFVMAGRDSSPTEMHPTISLHFPSLHTDGRGSSMQGRSVGTEGGCRVCGSEPVGNIGGRLSWLQRYNIHEFLFFAR